MVEVPPPNPEDDSFSDSSVTTDEEPPLSPAKKNIHLRRWKLVSKGDGTFVIEGGKRPKEISWGPRDKLFGEGEEHLFNADFVLCVPSPYVFPWKAQPPPHLAACEREKKR